MKTTVTAAFAIASLAGMAMAEIATPAAGYTDFTGSSTAQYVCNPFNSFTNATPKLGDIDGSALDDADDYIKVINSAGALVFRATWKTVNGVTGWYDAENALKNDYVLARGNSIQFNGESGGKLVIAGYIDATDKTFALTATAQNWIGNTSPLAKSIADIVPSSFNTRKDNAYFMHPTTGALTQLYYIPDGKVTGVDAGWYEKADIASQSTLQNATPKDWTLASGQGFLMMPGSAGVTVTVDTL